VAARRALAGAGQQLLLCAVVTWHRFLLQAFAKRIADQQAEVQALQAELEASNARRAEAAKAGPAAARAQQRSPDGSHARMRPIHRPEP
jgi:hypothetical protein